MVQHGRRWFGTYRVCIIGSGPAGLYTAQKLLKKVPPRAPSHTDTSHDIQIDIIEKLHTPYGLIRYGVAPDHPEIKNCIRKFEKIFQDECLLDRDRLQWFGGLSLGESVHVKDLSKNYHAVSVSIGAQKQKFLNIPGESNFFNIVPSISWTNFINSYPSKSCYIQNLNFPQNISNSTILSPDMHKKAVILGNGNVALDVARILLSPIDLLKKTDISSSVLSVLSGSSIRHVNIVGRRGPGQVSFTPAELRELFQFANTENIPIFINTPDILSQLNACLDVDSRVTQSLVKLFKNAHFIPIDNWNVDISKMYNCDRSITFSFLASPKSFQGNLDNKLATTLIYEENEFIASQAKNGYPVALPNEKVIGTGKYNHFDASLFITCIGYAIAPIPGLEELQNEQGLIPHTKGKVNTNDKTSHYPNLFISGWCKHGPIGQLADTMLCAYETADSILNYLNNLTEFRPLPGRQWLLSTLNASNVNYSTYQDWLLIDTNELALGEQNHKFREKF